MKPLKLLMFYLRMDYEDYSSWYFKVELEIINNWVQSEPVNVVSYILNTHRTWGDGMTPAFFMLFNLNFFGFSRQGCCVDQAGLDSI